MRIEITGKLLTKNWLLNLAGQLAPLIVAVAAMPFVIHELGSERFGILSIAWVLLSYSTLLDLGFGRATTKFFAEHLGRDESEKLPAVLWTSVWAQLAFGLAGAVVFAAITSPLVDHLLRMSPSLRADTKVSFFILAGSLPIVLVGNAFRAVLEATQRFDLVNYVRVPLNSSIFLLPALALPLGIGLPGVVLLLVLARLAGTLAYLSLCLWFFPVLRSRYSGDASIIRTLLVYGGWVTVSNVASPLMSNLDRFFIGSIVSVSAVGYYTAPFEAVSRCTVLPASLASTIFPAFSSLDAVGSSKKLEELCVRSLKSLVLTLGPVLLLIIVFAHQILQAWLGPDFAAKGTLVLQILAAGTLINSLAYIPSSLLQGLNRPDLTAKFHVLELPLYVGVLWFLLKHMGISGAALAWSLRVTIDAFLLFGAVVFCKWIPLKSLFGNGLLKSALLTLFFGALLVLTRSAMIPLWLSISFAAILLLSFGLAAWRFLLDGTDRSLVVHTAGHLRSTFAREK
jgi:O-antigen/teichoic acid export membrane protein